MNRRKFIWSATGAVLGASCEATANATHLAGSHGLLTNRQRSELISGQLEVSDIHSPAGQAVALLPSKATVIDLSGKWDFRFDEYGLGEAEKWYQPDVIGSWESINVPGSFNDQFDSMNAYAGKAWYRTDFSVVSQPGHQIFITLEGVVLRSKVWINGRLAAQSLLPFTPLNIEITEFLNHDGKTNTLVVETDNKILAKGIPDLMWHGWQNDGGLIWPVSLVICQSIYSTSRITTKMNGKQWDVDLHILLHSSSEVAHATVEIRIVDETKEIWSNAIDVSLKPGETPLNFSATLDHVRAWSPDSPNLYQLIVHVHNDVLKSIETDQTTFGFREISINGPGIMLNGEPLLLRGINRHSFYPGVGMSVPSAQTWKDFENIKALGANFVRLAHYSQPKEVYQACDALGLLVWTEVPAWQTRTEVLTDPSVWSDYVAPLLYASVTLHWNHPSVIVWSVANEIASEKPEIAKFIEKAVTYVKQLDSSRLVTFASDKRQYDVSFGSVDFIAINEYYGWYYGNEDDLGPVLDLLHTKYPQKPIFVSEYGAESIEGWQRTNPKSNDYSFNHQVQFLEHHLAQIYSPTRRSFMAGGAIWLYNDFPLPFPRGIDFSKSTWPINAKGLVTQQRMKKPAWTTVESFYTSLKDHATSSDSNGDK